VSDRGGREQKRDRKRRRIKNGEREKTERDENETGGEVKKDDEFRAKILQYNMTDNIT
jgi:hypothetical protein